MLKKFIPFLRSPALNDPDESNLELFEFESYDTDHIKNGILLCRKSGNWFPINNEVLELIRPELMYPDDRRKFYEKYKDKFSELGIKYEVESNNTGGDVLKNQFEQRSHYDDFAVDKSHNYDDYAMQSFWQAMDRKVFGEWKSKIKDGSMILDVGCGNGRSAGRIYKENTFLAGIDISKKSVERAIESSKEKGNYRFQTFFIADADRIPFKDGTFDFAVTSGVLSQLPDAVKTSREIQKKLKKGGIHFGMENNRSVFRIFFDFLTNFTKSWKKNKKGLTPEINKNMLDSWFNKGDVDIQSYTSVYLPPTYYNKMNPEEALSKIEKTDKTIQSFPFLKNNGGLIIFEIKKTKTL